MAVVDFVYGFRGLVALVVDLGVGFMGWWLWWWLILGVSVADGWL